MKVLLILIVFLAFLINSNGQPKKHNNSRLEIDTLNIKGDSLLTRISTFENDTLIKVTTAFLFPDSIRIPRYRLFGNLFTKNISISRLLKHGKTIVFTSDRKKKVTEYYYNKEILTSYYDQDNKEISKDEYIGNNLQIGTCGTEIKEFLILPQGKK